MRPYRIWFSKDNDTGRVNCWYVTDQTDEENEQEYKLVKGRNVHELWRYRHREEIRPRVATFPVSQLYPSDEQERRAKMLCDYLNRIREATEQAEKHAVLIDAIRGAPDSGDQS